jgi:hypothetical protein
MQSKLPYKSAKIKIIKDFTKTKDKKLKPYINDMGVCFFETGEIYLNKKYFHEILDRKNLTLIHEMVHLRKFKDNNNKAFPGYIDEDETELEALTRSPYNNLTQAERILKNYLLNDGNIKLNPNNPKHLNKIIKKIYEITDPYYAKRIRFLLYETQKKAKKWLLFYKKVINKYINRRIKK